MHFVVMGCGRVGALLATQLDADGHSVSIIDADPKAFRRLSPDFSGRKVTGQGIDRDVLRKAGTKDAYAFAAVSSGDNSNIIAARVAREIFGVERVVARIYDPSRATVYERLGIPTVATVRRTSEAVLRWMLPRDAHVAWNHPTGLVSLVSAQPSPEWYGLPLTVVEELLGTRIAFISRFGHPTVATPDLVVQEDDEIYFAEMGTHSQRIRDMITAAPMIEE